MPIAGNVRWKLWVNILTPWADSSMLFPSERHGLPFLFINHAMAPVSRSLCLILRRTNEFFRKGVDSFSTLPIMRLHTAGVISSAGRAPPLQGGGRRFDPVITHHFGSLAQLVEQLTFNQLVAGSNPARPTNVKRRPKGAFLLSAFSLPLINVNNFLIHHFPTVTLRLPCLHRVRTGRSGRCAAPSPGKGSDVQNSSRLLARNRLSCLAYKTP